jgi:hypothetical protein
MAASIIRAGRGSPSSGQAACVFDPKTEKINEWKKPLEWESPYDVVDDRTSSIMRCRSGDIGLLFGELRSCELHMQQRQKYRADTRARMEVGW